MIELKIDSSRTLGENHRVLKIPLYFDEVSRSKPNQRQSVMPVTSPSSKCRGTQSCATCAPFEAQGYYDTLC